MKGDTENAGFETRAIHAGQAPDPATGAVAVPIYQTSTYAQHAVGQTYGGYEYSRTHNPTRKALEECIASLESGAYGLGFSSGMAAINTVAALLKPGDHVILGDDVYGGTYRLFHRVWQHYGITYSLVDLTNPDKAVDAFRPETKMVWLETPTNPWLKSIDIAQTAEMAHHVGALLAVDNTFASPYLQRPLTLGADIVVHSATKYLGGHSDVVGGSPSSTTKTCVIDLPSIRTRRAARRGRSIAGSCCAESKHSGFGCVVTARTRGALPNSYRNTGASPASSTPDFLPTRIMRRRGATSRAGEPSAAWRRTRPLSAPVSEAWFRSS